MRPLRAVFWFGVVGGLGFLVDTAVLYLLRGALGPLKARVFSFLAAVLSTWLLNRRLTFRGRSSGLSAKPEFAAYLLLMLVGGLVNYGTYAWLIVSYRLVLEHPVIGVAAGSLAGMAINLASSRFLLFRHGADRDEQ